MNATTGATGSVVALAGTPGDSGGGGGGGGGTGVPEPSSALLFGAGLLGLGALRRRRRPAMNAANAPLAANDDLKNGQLAIVITAQ